ETWRRGGRSAAVSVRGRSGALVWGVSPVFFLAHCDAALQVAPGCPVFLAGRGRRGESGSAAVSDKGPSTGVPGRGLGSGGSVCRLAPPSCWLKHRRFYLNMRRNFALRVLEPWNRLSREVVESPLWRHSNPPGHDLVRSALVNLL
ncbi:hypothetical protein Q9966_004432, partial [Columba livia]